MGTWTLIQIVFNIFMAAGLFTIVMRLNRAPKDDPRLSRGLQLLQSKIAVLEDLSDRTESQVAQLTSILESKAREVQAKVQLAEQHVNEIRISMDRSLEVAKIFQDKIPHKEIIERQNTLKYIQAARLAHQGSTVEEIAQAVDLPRGEVEFIASVNRERLMFDETNLPEWAKDIVSSDGSQDSSSASITPSQAAAAGVTFNTSQDTGPIETQAEQTSRLRAEIELSESQRLVENLSRLQTEMQHLDQQLARENSNRDFAGAFEVPRIESDSLKKLGEEFRKAVKDGEVSDARQPFLMPLDQLNALIPNIIEAGEDESAAAQRDSSNPATIQHTISEVLSAPISAPSAPTYIGATSADPVLARAVAQSKVQAALRSSAKPAAPKKATNQTSELNAARALAREVAPKTVQRPPIGVSANAKAAAPKAEKGEVRKVVFPRIDGSDA